MLPKRQNDKEYEIDIDPDVFNNVYLPYINNLSRVQIFFGGSSSGKSVFLAQRDIVKILKGGRNFLVCRQVGKTLRGSVVQELVKVINDWNLEELFTINKTDGTITCQNGYQIVFCGLDDVEKLKSMVPAKGVFTDIRIEEATEVSKNSIKQLMKRQRGGDPTLRKTLTLSLNPILKTHWIYTEYFSGIGWADNQIQYQGERVCILKTWYIHNRFLTPDDVYDLEHETDKYYYNVYTLGNWGILGNVIFTNWKVEDLSGMRDQFTNRRNGLDFGFADDPAACGASHYDKKRKTIYVFGELYERGLTNDLLAAEIKNLIGADYVTCDSAEPKSIAELIKFGVRARAAKKGKDSVNFGIQWLQRQTIIMDTSCIHAHHEISTYHWKEDKDGNAMKIPVDKDNHFIDQLRYAYEDDMEDLGRGAGLVAFAG
jgi:phage terminase large subunit